MVSTQPSPESLAIDNESRRSVMRALAEVPIEQRQAFELAFFEGFSHSEIADQLGEPLGTVKTRIRQAVGRLRELLKGAV